MKQKEFFLLVTPLWCTCNYLFLIFSKSFLNALLNKEDMGLLEIWEKIREVKLLSFSSSKIVFIVLLIEMLCVKFKMRLEAILTQIVLSHSLLSKIYTFHYSKSFIFFTSFCFHSSFMRPLYKWGNTKWLILRLLSVNCGTQLGFWSPKSLGWYSIIFKKSKLSDPALAVELIRISSAWCWMRRTLWANHAYF